MRKIQLFATVVATLISVCGYSQLSYKINATGQTLCYDGEGNVIETPNKKSALYGQDANYLSGAEMSFKDNGDGTVSDPNTGLMWQQTPPMEGMTWAQAKEYCENLEFGGYSDWRLPTLKELFSISDFSSGWPYLDTEIFKLSSSRISKDEQYWAEELYVGETVEGRNNAAFGVNHVTGHIKAYPAGGAGGSRSRSSTTQSRDSLSSRSRSQPQSQSRSRSQPQRQTMNNPMAKQVRAVRGEIYGANNFVDNGDGTICDTATGLMWAKEDNGAGIEWINALPYAESSKLAGYRDWRLPNVKELQSIVDYTRAPSSKGTEAAIDPIFSCTPFVNEAGDDDFGYYWTGTSACFRKGKPYYFAWYVAFGRAVNSKGKDMHGAGAVRFDSKSNNDMTVEGGEERYHNFVRLVRNISKK